MRLILSLLVLLTVSLTAPVVAQNAGPFHIVETGRSYYRLDDAVKSFGKGDATILIAPGIYHDCARIEAGNVTLRAAVPGKAIFDSITCEGKAALVLSSRNVKIEGIVFQNMRVPDANGAGVRLEHGNLTILNSVFRNSEEGILSGDDPEGIVAIDHTTFSGLGRCDRGLSCAHSVYIGLYGRVIVTHSRFERGLGGQYLKSRAAHSVITDNSFDDVHGHATNYMIDLCAGSTGQISGNVMVMGKDKENHSAIIAIAAEGRNHPSAGLAIANNSASLAPDAEYQSVFVADWSHEPLRVGPNKIYGRIAKFETR